MRKIVLIGAGGHCKSVIDVIEKDGYFEIIGILDKNYKSLKNVLGYPILGDDSLLTSIKKKCDNAFVSIGSSELSNLREEKYNFLKKVGFRVPSIISPNAYVSDHSKIGTGTIIMHFAQVNADSEVGVNCIINSGSLIEHDSFIGDHSHVSTNAVINGNVEVGRGCFIGSNSTIKHGITIKEKSFIKASSLIK